MGHMFLRVVGLFILTGLLAACGSAGVKLNSATIGKIENRKLALVVGQRPKLKIMTPEKSIAGSGLLASLIVDALSDDIAKDYRINDPAKKVGQAIKQSLARRHGMRSVASAKQADLVLQVKTNYWQVDHGPLNFTSYFPRLNLSAKLIDAKTNTVLSEGACIYIQAVTPGRGYDEILQNSGAVLKADLNKMAGKCAREILAKAF